jgi:glycogen debranching enzyme
MLRGTLARVAATQAREDSAWHDEEPGKMIHEMRRGPLAELEIIPQRAYYGTQTTPAMFVLALSEYWHWTGDTHTLQRYVKAALRTFEWAARYGDRDGDGFLEYVKRSPKGLKNHAWKDSDEAIRYPDGRLVENPIAYDPADYVKAFDALLQKTRTPRTAQLGGTEDLDHPFREARVEAEA